MKVNKKIWFFMTLALISILGFGCSKDSSSIQKENIDKFLKEEAGLYERQEEIVGAFETSDTMSLEEKDDDLQAENPQNKKLEEILKDVKDLLTEKEYERLMANRYLIGNDLLEGNYDKSEIKDIDYDLVSEDKEKVVYLVQYTEELYFENDLNEEKSYIDEFTLEKIDKKWLISRIEPISKE